MPTQIRHVSIKKMHKYVLGIIGVFIIFAATFPIAGFRVSQDKKFANFHLKSLTIEGQLPKLSGEPPNIQSVINTPSEQIPQTLGIVAASIDQSVNPANQTAEITEPEYLAVLNQKLYGQIAQNWQSRRFEEKLVYLVSISQNGVIASYVPLNQAARDYEQQTPLPSLTETNRQRNSSTDAGNTSDQAERLTSKPVGKFEVAFTRRGILEVSPWQGWRKRTLMSETARGN